MSNDQPSSIAKKAILVAQIFSVLFIWVFVVAITLWIINLILLAVDLNDAPGASVAISIVAIPIFVTLASILTFVFVGLHKKTQSSTSKTEEK